MKPYFRAEPFRDPNEGDESRTAELMRFYEYASRLLRANTSQQALQITVQVALEATAAHSAILYLVDFDGKITTRFGQNQTGNELDPEPAPRPDGATQRILHANQPWLVTGSESDASQRIHPHLWRAGIRAAVGLPLTRENGAALGVLYVRFTEARRLTLLEMRGLELYCSQAASTIERLRLLEESRRREADMGVLMDTAHMALSALDIKDLLQQIAIRLAWASGVEECSISTYEAEPAGLRTLAHYTTMGAVVEDELGKFYPLEAYPLTAQTLESGVPVYVREDDPGADPAETALLRSLGFCDVLMLPMRARGEPAGLVELYRRSNPSAPTAGKLNRLRLMTELTAIALVNARSYAEEQRNRLTAETLRQASAAINDTLELGPMLEVILEQLQRVVAFNSASVMLIDGSEMYVAAVRGHPFAAEALKVRFRYAKDALAQPIVAAHAPLILPDARLDTRFASHGRAHYVRGWMGVPLSAHGLDLGVLTLDSVNPDAFTLDDARLAMAFAAQAAAAVLNARAFELEREQRALAEALHEISFALASSLKANAILETILDQIDKVITYDSASVLLLDGDVVRAAYQRGYGALGEDDPLNHFELSLEATPILKRMAESLRADVISDVRNEPLWVHNDFSGHVNSWVGAPLVARDRLLGFLSLDKTQPGYYTLHHAERLVMLAGHAALALLNAMAYGEVERASITDFITGAYNHRYFHQQLNSELERAAQKNYPVSLLMLDLDHFKAVNDTYGHPVGDRVLKELATRLRAELRTVDFLARYGGEEFAVLLPATTPEGLCKVAARLLLAVSQRPFAVGEITIHVTISIGGACLPIHAHSARELIRQADQAMYQAKDEGRNRFCLASPLDKEN